MVTLSWLAEVLRNEGCEVVELSGWTTRAVPGSFDPIGVLWHHTNARSSASNPVPSLDNVIEGRPDLVGPLCHALLGYAGCSEWWRRAEPITPGRVAAVALFPQVTATRCLLGGRSTTRVWPRSPP